MTADELVKTVFSVVVGMLAGSVAWLVRTVLVAKEALLLHEARLKKLEEEVHEVKTAALTVECIRDVVNEALDRRDTVATERRLEWDKFHRMEMRTIVQEELEKILPRLVREIMGDPKKRSV